MKNDSNALVEKNGQWSLHGVPIRIGVSLIIDGMLSKVLSMGRLPNEAQTPYLWIQNDLRTTVYAPALMEDKISTVVRSSVKSFAARDGIKPKVLKPCLTAA